MRRRVSRSSSRKCRLRILLRRSLSQLISLASPINAPKSSPSIEPSCACIAEADDYRLDSLPAEVENEALAAEQDRFFGNAAFLV